MKKSMTLFAFVVLCGFASQAYDFSAVNSEGITLYYNILTDATDAVELTYDDENHYSGSVNVPAEVAGGGQTYTVTSIGDYAFASCSELTAVTISTSVISIGDSAFYDCSRLAAVSIPTSVTIIGEHAFYGCSRLAAISIPNSVTTIGGYAFAACSLLSSVTVGDSVTDFGEWVFGGTLWYGTDSNWTDSMLYCGKYLLKADQTLAGSHVIKPGTTCIARYAFDDCTRLTSLTVPAEVTHIGNGAFEYCERLTSLITLNANPPVADSAFGEYGYIARDQMYYYYFDMQNVALHVPAGSESSYAAAAGWRDFSNIIGDADSTGVGIETAADDADIQLQVRNGEIVLANGQGAQVQVYNLAGVLVYSGRPYGESRIAVPQRGLYVVRAGNAPAKKVVVM